MCRFVHLYLNNCVLFLLEMRVWDLFLAPFFVLFIIFNYLYNMFNKFTQIMTKNFNYNDWFMQQRTDNDLRSIMFDESQLDSERNAAKKEMARRTHKQKIDDTLTRRIEIA